MLTRKFLLLNVVFALMLLGLAAAAEAKEQSQSSLRTAHRDLKSGDEEEESDGGGFISGFIGLVVTLWEIFGPLALQLLGIDLPDEAMEQLPATEAPVRA